MCISVLRLLNHFTSNHWNNITTSITSWIVLWWSNTVYYLLYAPESASKARGTIKCFRHSEVLLVAWVFTCLALPFWSQLLSLPFSCHAQAQLHRCNSAGLRELGEFTFFCLFVWDFYSSLVYPFLSLSDLMLLPVRVTSTERQLNGFQNSLHSAASCEPGTNSTGECQCWRLGKWGWACWDAFIFLKNWQGKNFLSKKKKHSCLTSM